MEGIGLGLVICKMIVKKFNGKINFVSKYKEGSTFFYSFELEEINPMEDNKSFRQMARIISKVDLEAIVEKRQKNKSLSFCKSNFESIKKIL
jgi:hypothetical protein